LALPSILPGIGPGHDPAAGSAADHRCTTLYRSYISCRVLCIFHYETAAMSIIDGRQNKQVRQASALGAPPIQRPAAGSKVTA